MIIIIDESMPIAEFAKRLAAAKLRFTHLQKGVGFLSFEESEIKPIQVEDVAGLRLAYDQEKEINKLLEEK